MRAVRAEVWDGVFTFSMTCVLAGLIWAGLFWIEKTWDRVTPDKVSYEEAKAEIEKIRNEAGIAHGELIRSTKTPSKVLEIPGRGESEWVEVAHTAFITSFEADAWILEEVVFVGGGIETREIKNGQGGGWWDKRVKSLRWRNKAKKPTTVKIWFYQS